MAAAAAIDLVEKIVAGKDSEFLQLANARYAHGDLG
jgi:hypothetical protein